MPVCGSRAPRGLRGGGVQGTGLHTFRLHQAAILLLACNGGDVCARCSGPQQRGRGALH